MRILVVGKKQQMHWPENVAKFLPPQHDRSWFVYNKKTLLGLLYKILGKGQRYRSSAFKKAILQFKPDMIFFVSSFFIPMDCYQIAAQFPNILKIGWAGDRFGLSDPRLSYMDVLFYSDSGYVPSGSHLPCRTVYLPLCADETVFKKTKDIHNDLPFFAGDANPWRMAYLKAIQTPVNIWGSHWNKKELMQHYVHNKKLSHQKICAFYNRSMAPINMTFSKNIVDGLNFRTFEIGAAGGLIIINEGKDLNRCYDVGQECVTYKTPEDLNNLVADIIQNSTKYQKIADAGYKRTLKEHTYTRRLEQMFEKLKEFYPKNK